MRLDEVQIARKRVHVQLVVTIRSMGRETIQPQNTSNERGVLQSKTADGGTSDATTSSSWL